MFSLPKAWVQSLVRELRSHKLHAAAKKKKKRERIEPLSSQEISRSISSDGSTLKPKCVGGAGV